MLRRHETSSAMSVIHYRRVLITSHISGLTMVMLFVFVHIFISSVQSSVLTDKTVGCPEACSCVSVRPPDVSIVVNCSHSGLVSVPVSIPEGTMELDISANPDITKLTFVKVKLSSLHKLRRLIVRSCHLGQISADVFSRERLPRLDILDLSHNDIEKMPVPPDHTFAQTSLSTLLLSRNKIRSITDIQLKLYPFLLQLNVDNNLIVTLNNGSFSPMTNSGIGRVLALETLSMRHNRIAHIDSGVFKQMTLLKRLDLSRNRLSSIDANVFAGLTNLQHLDLSANQLRLVQGDAFSSLASLHHLDLSRNKLPWIPRGLPMLDWFDISHNAVRNVSEDQQADLYPLEVMNLAHNPLHCDCHMLWLKELFDSREYLLRLKVIDVDPADFVPTCATPDSIASESWELLGDDVFVCRDDGGAESTAGATSPTDLLHVRLGAVSDTTVEIHWSIESHTSPFNTVVIQHYVFGLRAATFKHVQISATLRQYMLRRLRPATSYMVCVVPNLGGAVDGNNVTPFSFSHCAEVTTKEAVVTQELPSHTSLFSCYVCSMMVTIACVLCCIGGAAMIFGVAYSDDTEESDVDEHACNVGHANKQHTE
ncbi:hypothetical protein LSAT2_002400 [Lamellibrachia satsuma]|nr:hypothetical protein LSAT2_002400 [Lamellibrachia satsuma]